MTKRIIAICLTCICMVGLLAGCANKPDPNVDIDYSIYEPKEADEKLSVIMKSPGDYIGKTLKITGEFQWKTTYETETIFAIRPNYTKYGIELPFQLKEPWQSPDEWPERAVSMCLIGTLQIIETPDGGTRLALVNAEIVKIDK